MKLKRYILAKRMGWVKTKILILNTELEGKGLDLDSFTGEVYILCLLFSKEASKSPSSNLS